MGVAYGALRAKRSALEFEALSSGISHGDCFSSFAEWFTIESLVIPIETDISDARLY